MKKNLLTVLILALLIVDIILDSVEMISNSATNKKTAKLVGDIATIIGLQITEPGGEEAETVISLADTSTMDLSGPMTIPLADGTYILFNVSLSMNTKHKDYKTYGESVSEKESLIKDAITSVVTVRTQNQCRNDFEGLKADILKAIQDMYQSDFIYNISIIDIKYG